jgi:nucleotide-binding universal stress UspA family protein
MGTVTETGQQVVEVLHPSGGVVVGDDGSDCSGRAVRYALEEARRWGGVFHVVRAWSLTSAVRPEDADVGYVPSLEEFEAATLAAERRRVQELLGPEPAAPVEVHVVHSPAAQALIEASQTADVLVVGSRGRVALVLGSVADQCVRHAAEPVVVVH